MRPPSEAELLNYVKEVCCSADHGARGPSNLFLRAVRQRYGSFPFGAFGFGEKLLPWLKKHGVKLGGDRSADAKHSRQIHESSASGVGRERSIDLVPPSSRVQAPCKDGLREQWLSTLAKMLNHETPVLIN